MIKSYVTMAQAVCPVCGKLEDTGELLLDRRLKERFEAKTTIGWALCEAHAKLYAMGYIALVEAKEPGVGQTLKLEEAERTGTIAHVRFKAFEGLFSQPVPQKDGSPLSLCFVAPGVVDALDQATKAAAEELSPGQGDDPAPEPS